MASGKMCSCGRYKAGKTSPYCKNCRRLFRKWGEEKDLWRVVKREQNLSAWQAPVVERLQQEPRKVEILKRKRVA